jgi:hypothetical protein
MVLATIPLTPITITVDMEIMAQTITVVIPTEIIHTVTIHAGIILSIHIILIAVTAIILMAMEVAESVGEMALVATTMVGFKMEEEVLLVQEKAQMLRITTVGL